MPYHLYRLSADAHARHHSFLLGVRFIGNGCLIIDHAFDYYHELSVLLATLSFVQIDLPVNMPLYQRQYASLEAHIILLLRFDADCASLTPYITSSCITYFTFRHKLIYRVSTPSTRTHYSFDCYRLHYFHRHLFHIYMPFYYFICVILKCSPTAILKTLIVWICFGCWVLHARAAERSLIISDYW